MNTLAWGDIQRNPTIIACLNVIANSISILPLNLYFKNPKTGERQKADWHNLFGLLRRRPNLSDSPTLFMAKLVRHILAKGNAYIFRNIVDGKLTTLHLLNPQAVTERYSGMTTTYLYAGTEYTEAQILHIPSLVTDDHGKGFSPVELARAAVILGIQLDEYSLSAFGNGLNTKLLLDIADMTKDVKTVDEAQKIAQQVSDYIKRNYAGAENAGKALITWNGMKATEIKGQSSNQEAQLLEARKYQEIEICKVLGVPPFLINGTYEVKYGGLEQAMMIFLNFCLSPIMRHIEQRLGTLLDAYEQETYYFEFDFNVLLRPDQKSRAEFYSKLFGMGAIDPAGICAKENLDPPAEAGNVRFVPANMMPLLQSVVDAYMAGAKLKAEELGSGGGLSQPSPAQTDPSTATGSQAQ